MAAAGMAATGIAVHDLSEPFSALQLVFLAWVASPFVAISFMLWVLHSRLSRRAGALFMQASALIVAFASTALYADTVFHPKGSTGALVFVFLPLWSHLLLVLVSFIGAFTTRAPDQAAGHFQVPGDPKSGA